MTILYKILGWIVIALGFISAIFSAGYFKRGERQANKNTKILNDVIDAANNAEIKSREDLKRVKKETDNSDFSDLNQ